MIKKILLVQLIHLVRKTTKIIKTLSIIDMKNTTNTLIFILIATLLALIILHYSRTIDGFEVPRFVKIAPVAPKEPPPSTNSNGGLVSIS